MRQKVNKILKDSYGQDVATNVLTSYYEIQNNFIIKKWKPSELDAGHFVEAVRRILEFELFGTSTPISKKLENFNDAVLKRYEQATGKHESFRILIPRVLKSIYNIRNKRGVAHVGNISPNEMDSTYILYSVKWVFSEIIRLKSQLSFQKTQDLVNLIIERQIELLWKKGDIKRILDPKMSARNQVLILLYDKSPLYKNALLEVIEYRNPTDFCNKVLRSLHKKRLIEYQKNGFCHITPNGVIEAENILLSKKIKT